MLRTITGGVERGLLTQRASNRAQKCWQSPSHTYPASPLRPTLLSALAPLPSPGSQLRKQKVVGRPIRVTEFVLRALSKENLNSVLSQLGAGDAVQPGDVTKVTQGTCSKASIPGQHPRELPPSLPAEAQSRRSLPASDRAQIYSAFKGSPNRAYRHPLSTKCSN